jgi:hypothetical protein
MACLRSRGRDGSRGRFLTSLRDLGRSTFAPSAEALGYFQSSLRDDGGEKREALGVLD